MESNQWGKASDMVINKIKQKSDWAIVSEA